MSLDIIAPNRLKRALRDGKTVIGTMLVEVRQPSVMQMLANAGLDFVIIDNEHGTFNIETIADLSRFAKKVGITPIVRVPEWSYAQIVQPLDGGAQGIMTPRITDPQQVRDVLSMMKYPPVGRRGSVVARGHTDLKSGPLLDVMKTANEESLLVVQIETRQALDNLDAIASIPGVDIAFAGPTDLSVSMGIGGKITDPLLVSALESVMQACQRHKIFSAVQMNDLELAALWAKKGMRMVSYLSEVGILTNAAANAVSVISKAAAR